MLPVASALLLAWIVPQLTAVLLRVLLLRNLPDEVHAPRARLFGFRRAAMIVGVVQIALLAGHGAQSVGPALVVVTCTASTRASARSACCSHWRTESSSSSRKT